ncbi:MAG: hypothetical protein ACI9WC_003329, partial [Arenicella sp.]
NGRVIATLDGLLVIQILCLRYVNLIRGGLNLSKSYF